MSARRPIFNALVAPFAGNLPVGHDEAKQLLDAYRAEVLREGGTAVDALDRRVHGIAADTIKDAWEEGRDCAAYELRAMADEADEEKAAAPEGEATPDFFQPGRTYAYQANGFTAPELVTLFRVQCTTTHPATGAPFAFGWIRGGESTEWAAYAEPADDWPHAWTEITEGGAS